ncbi:unnamed protein product [Microthlaspi erraticum]|uniref:Actin-related protein 8 n=1 Tax=Microthlaspi erraticum TaxID=1685480 RepID=A0A6D2I962_9BRAS|nr:unnamed protein product [Microthlaspi erraticum]
MKPLSRLPTLLRGNSIVVTNNSASEFSYPNQISSSKSLDFSRYSELGNGELGNGDSTLADSLHPCNEFTAGSRALYGPLRSKAAGLTGDDSWFKTVVLAGGSAYLPGLAERLERELHDDLPSSICNGVKVIPPPCGVDTAWHGAKLISQAFLTL